VRRLMMLEAPATAPRKAHRGPCLRRAFRMRIGITVSLLAHGGLVVALLLLHEAHTRAAGPVPSVVVVRQAEALPPEPRLEEPARLSAAPAPERWETEEEAPEEPPIPPVPAPSPLGLGVFAPAPVPLKSPLHAPRPRRPAPAPLAKKAPAPSPAPRPEAAPRLEPPRLLDGAAASVRYPDLARRRGLAGTVLLRVRVAADGTVESAEVATSSGHEILDQAAVEAVRRWRFAPARRGDTAVAHEVRVPIEFKLTDA
jgi:protein TonB